jgi:hypothetical protein
MADLDRLKAAVAKVLAPFLARIDYQALYEATVVAQNDDGSLELRPDTPKLPPLSRVGIRYGVPGIKATLNPNGHVLVGFANADPTKPFALVWDGATIQSLCLFDGTKPVARMSDAVNVFFPPLIPISGTLAGAPFAGVLTITTSAPGIITTGNPKVTA